MPGHFQGHRKTMGSKRELNKDTQNKEGPQMCKEGMVPHSYGVKISPDASPYSTF